MFHKSIALVKEQIPKRVSYSKCCVFHSLIMRQIYWNNYFWSTRNISELIPVKHKWILTRKKRVSWLIPQLLQPRYNWGTHCGFTLNSGLTCMMIYLKLAKLFPLPRAVRQVMWQLVIHYNNDSDDDTHQMATVVETVEIFRYLQNLVFFNLISSRS